MSFETEVSFPCYFNVQSVADCRIGSEHLHSAFRCALG